MVVISGEEPWIALEEYLTPENDYASAQAAAPSIAEAAPAAAILGDASRRPSQRRARRPPRR
jgi:hypothetical protein